MVWTSRLIGLYALLQLSCGEPPEPDSLGVSEQPGATATDSPAKPPSVATGRSAAGGYAGAQVRTERVGETAPQSSLAAADLDCKTYAASGGAPVKPIGVSAAAPRYFSFAGRDQVLVGVSADAACHLFLDDPALCSMANFTSVLADASAQQLNKLRLWVAFIAEKDPRNFPFSHVTAGAGAPYWRLDVKNQEYFDRLRQVVNLARQKDLFVEVTFFAPFEGGEFKSGPWAAASGKAKALKGGRLVNVGFSDEQYFVFKDTRAVPEATANEAMREYQQNVIKWTIDELWCFDNVYWEIANEPESRKVFPVNVAAWQKQMISKAVAEDNSHAPLLQQRHLIAVQPFTARGTAQFTGHANTNIINGHYTTVAGELQPTLPDNTPSRLDAGAIQMVRAHPDKPKIFGFNETKITPLGGSAGTRVHVDGAVQEGRPEPARAEAWEFLFNQGGTYDHYGYLGAGPTPVPPFRPIRQQLATLRALFDTLPLSQLRTGGPAWSDIGAYASYEPASGSHKYWAALQPADAAASRVFLLYIHHSTPRCKDNKEYTASGCPGNVLLPFGGYDARVFTTAAKMYRERLQLQLGARPGRFTATWSDPETLTSLKEQTFTWDPGSGGTCSIPACRLESPPYKFDILLKINPS